MTAASTTAPGPTWCDKDVLDTADAATIAALSPPGDPLDVVAVRDTVERYSDQHGASRLIDLTVALAVGRVEALESFARFGGSPEHEVAAAVEAWVSESR